MPPCLATYEPNLLQSPRRTSSMDPRRVDSEICRRRMDGPGAANPSFQPSRLPLRGMTQKGGAFLGDDDSGGSTLPVGWERGAERRGLSVECFLGMSALRVLHVLYYVDMSFIW
ncbi:hypothetical protein KM043_005167 [Ampulex compressa]|nr:hypothetical protein KM043_005167 [Ampulex compressa]